MSTSVEQSGLQTHSHGDMRWIDVINPDAAVFETLEKDYGLHPIHLHESLQKVQLTEVDREDGYIFLLLHTPVYDPANHKIHARQTGLFLGKDFVVTIHQEPSTQLTRAYEFYTETAGHKELHAKQGPGYLLYCIIKGLLENLSEATLQIFSELDAVESLVFDNSKSDAYRIGQLRQQINRLRRIVGPLREVLSDLGAQVSEFSGESLHKHYANNTKTANKLWEMMGEAAETVEIYKDADFTTSTERTNEILAVLTLIFTFTIPITVAGTLYGMNVLLPGGLAAGSWQIFGRYTTFVLIVALSAVVAGGMYWYFRRKKWF